jgi:ketosteroid isomerase-like protein
VELYPDEALEAARRHFAELTASPAATELTNDAFRRVLREVEWALADDWRALEAAISEDVVREDRRPMFRDRFEGRDAFMAGWQALRSVGVADIDVVPVATRGERLVLTGQVLRGHTKDGAVGEVEVVNLFEFGADGLLCGAWTFDPDDLDAAFAELEVRYAAGEAETLQDEQGAAIDFISAINARDWQRFESMLTQDFTFNDHRSVGLGSITRDDYIASMKAMAELSPDMRFRVSAVPRLSKAGMVYRLHVSGTNTSGGDFESEGMGLATWLGARQLARVEYFAVDDAERALRRFDELAAPPAPPALTNDATRRESQLVEWQLAGDWEAWAQAVSEDVVFDDRRPILRLRGEGRNAGLAAVKGAAAVGVTEIAVVPIATRGERLVLSRWTSGGKAKDGAIVEVEALMMHEFAADGRLRGACTFDPDDVDAAFSELDARYAAGEAAPFATTWTALVAAYTAYNARDWDAYGALCTDDFFFLDRRPVGLGDFDRKGFVASMRAIVELAPDRRIRMTAVHRIAEGVVAWVQEGTGTNATGGEFETFGVLVGVFDAGECRNVEVFPTDRLDDALRRFDELVAPAPSLEVTNDAARRLSRFAGWQVAGDFVAMAAAASENVVVDDRRTMVRLRLKGRDAVIANWRAIRAIGVTDLDVVPIAVRGEHLVLARMTFRGHTRDDDIGELHGLAVCGFTAHGLLVSFCFFDPDDLLAAIRELNDRYAAGLPTELRAALAGIVGRGLDRHNAKDFGAALSLLADDCVVVDRRVAGWGTVDRETYVGILRETSALAPDRFTITRVVHRLTAHGCVGSMWSFGTGPHGERFEFVWEMVELIRDGKVVRQEFFPAGQVDEALRRFDELSELRT